MVFCILKIRINAIIYGSRGSKTHVCHLGVALWIALCLFEHPFLFLFRSHDRIY